MYSASITSTRCNGMMSVTSSDSPPSIEPSIEPPAAATAPSSAACRAARACAPLACRAPGVPRTRLPGTACTHEIHATPAGRFSSGPCSLLSSERSESTSEPKSAFRMPSYR